MEIAKILVALDEEIHHLQQARAILTGNSKQAAPRKAVGKKRHLSAEARAKIAAAQKARWAKKRKEGK